ncbi:MAG: GFA family protein [Bdellovibrionota bacterium]|nr:GFA family protein [Bdellovibrionota bacterium]
MKLTGSCLCKSVKFSFSAEKKDFGVCHCSVCRKWGGGPAFVVQSTGDVAIEGEENVQTYQSSEWAERGFCKTCGTHLFYRMKEVDFCNFNLGTIDGNEDFEFSLQVFTDAKPESYSFSNQTHCMTEKEVLEAFSSKDS